MTRLLAPSLVLALAVLASPAPARAQSSCTHLTYDERGAVAEEARYVLDERGRIAVIEQRAGAAGSTRSELRHEGEELVEVRLTVLEGPDAAALGTSTLAVGTERPDERAVQRIRGPRPEHALDMAWTFDARGLPTWISRTAAGGEPEEQYCAYDLEGRPVARVVRSDEGDVASERAWIWEGDTLAQVAEESAEEESERTLTFRRRGDTLSLVDAHGRTTERWTGSCDSLLYGLCSPLLAPPRAGLARATLPASRGPRVARPRGRGGEAFPEAVLRAPLSLASLRAAYRSRAVWTTHTFFENAPDVPYAIVCAGPRGRCLTHLEHDDERRVRSVDTQDTTLRGPGGVRVGDRYERVAARFDRCELRLGLEMGVACRFRDAPHVEAWLALPEALESADEDAPIPPGALDGLRIERLAWRSSAE